MKLKISRLNWLYAIMLVVFIFAISGCLKNGIEYLPLPPVLENNNNSLIGEWHWNHNFGTYLWDESINDWVYYEGPIKVPYDTANYIFYSNKTVEIYFRYIDVIENVIGMYNINGNKISILSDNWNVYHQPQFFEIGQDSIGEYLIFYDNKIETNKIIHHIKNRRVN